MKNGNTKKKLDGNSFLLVVTIVLFFVTYIVGILTFDGRGFAKVQNLLNLFISNAGLIVVATGMTIVMITGGIDISVGSVVAMVCMMLARMMGKGGIGVILTIIIVLLTGCVLGLVQGFLVAYLKIQPFIVTLAGMSFARDMISIIGQKTISINSETSKSMATFKMYLPFGGYLNKKGAMIYPYIYPSAIIALVMLVLIFILLKYTKFERSIYAIGGNEQSALLLGLNVRKTKLQVYVLDGSLAGFGGSLFCMNTCSGFVEQARGFEMDATASSAIGGTLLTGGVGNMIDSLSGVSIKGIIESFIIFQGALSSWWARITIAALLCFFIVLQSLIATSRRRNRQNYVVAGHVQRVMDTSKNPGTASKGM